jgi:DNA polymerase-3 subunit chi
MTRVDFYLLSGDGKQEREKLACRLTEKAWKLNHNIYLHSSSEPESRQLDDLLWTFRPESFVPHDLMANDSEMMAPVLLGHHEEPALSEHDILINLSATVPSFFSRFERVIEVINEDESIRETGRDRYRFYQQRGYTLNTHKL